MDEDEDDRLNFGEFKDLVKGIYSLRHAHMQPYV